MSVVEDQTLAGMSNNLHKLNLAVKTAEPNLVSHLVDSGSQDQPVALALCLEITQHPLFHSVKRLGRQQRIGMDRNDRWIERLHSSDLDSAIGRDDSTVDWIPTACGRISISPFYELQHLPVETVHEDLHGMIVEFGTLPLEPGLELDKPVDLPPVRILLVVTMEPVPVEDPQVTTSRR
ncbi:hypothetical protein ES708_27051 [subsurface metagenome]